MAHYVYILFSWNDRKLYIGESTDVRRRLLDHNEGRVASTRNRRPFELIRVEEFATRYEASKRERFLKSPAGWKETKNIKKTFSSPRGVAQSG
ncbi:MAG: GIY-YIG nuclease family protein [Bacteroidota bacterium]